MLLSGLSSRKSYEWTRNGINLLSIHYRLREIFGMLDMEEVMCVSPLLATDSCWAMPKWPGSARLCHRAPLNYWWQAYLTQLSFPLACRWWQTLFSDLRGGDRKACAFHGLGYMDRLPSLSFVFKIWGSTRSSTNHHTAGRIIWSSRDLQAGTAKRAVGGESVARSWVTMGLSDYRDVLLGQIPAQPRGGNDPVTSERSICLRWAAQPEKSR